MPSKAPSRATRIFHQTLAATGSMAAAARAANIPLAEARRLRALPAPPGLAPRALAASPGEAEGQGGGEGRIEAAVAALEAEALRRALEGVIEPVFHQGRECGSKVKHSDTLLMFLLKTLRPERYGPATARRGAEGDPEGAEEDGHGLGAPGAFVLDLDLSAGEETGP